MCFELERAAKIPPRLPPDWAVMSAESGALLTNDSAEKCSTKAKKRRITFTTCVPMHARLLFTGEDELTADNVKIFWISSIVCKRTFTFVGKTPTHTHMRNRNEFKAPEGSCRWFNDAHNTHCMVSSSSVMCLAGYSIFVNPGELFSDSFVIWQQIPLLWIQLFYTTFNDIHPLTRTQALFTPIASSLIDELIIIIIIHVHPREPRMGWRKIALTSSQHIRTSILSGAALCHSQKSIWYRHQIDEIRIHHEHRKKNAEPLMGISR